MVSGVRLSAGAPTRKSRESGFSFFVLFSFFILFSIFSDFSRSLKKCRMQNWLGHGFLYSFYVALLSAGAVFKAPLALKAPNGASFYVLFLKKKSTKRFFPFPLVGRGNLRTLRRRITGSVLRTPQMRRRCGAIPQCANKGLYKNNNCSASTRPQWGYM